jgi:hypothetical protein
MSRVYVSQMRRQPDPRPATWTGQRLKRPINDRLSQVRPTIGIDAGGQVGLDSGVALPATRLHGKKD